jgi:protein O-GlcNAc transferase
MDFSDLDVANSHCERGDALFESGQPREALAEYRQALEAHPECARAWYSTGCVLLSRKEFVAAARAFRNGLTLVPDWLEALHNLGKALFELGHVDDACDCFVTAAEGPHSQLPAATLATILPGSPKAGNQSILENRRAFSSTIPCRNREFAFDKTAHSPLRLGYVSAFFHRENWMKPVWGLLKQHDRQAFEIHIFSDGASNGEAHPPVQPCDRFHDITGLTNELLAAHIEACGIDILVDLNGYSALRRLPLFALRPAPVIVGWFNHFATTGMPWYDCLIGDAIVIPAEEEIYYTERVVRVPGSYLTFEVGYPVPPVGPAPYLLNHDLLKRVITFGCLAPLYKITTDVIAVWSTILQRARGSLLLLKNSALASQANRQYLEALFAQHGVSPERLLLEGPAPHYEFLETYARIDVALDTFPYNGGTTTTEALWQGVPVIAFAGDRWVSRTSASLLIAGGLQEFVARDADDYIDIAVNLAASPNQVLTLRPKLRGQIRDSRLCDTVSFARNMERRYREAYDLRRSS